jgi:hypothetical protein
VSALEWIANQRSEAMNPEQQVLGYYVMGRHTSCAWYLRKVEAERVCKQMNYRGGTHYRVEPAEERNGISKGRP